MNKKIIVTITSVLTILLLTNIYFNNKEEIDEIDALVNIQNNLEDNFETEGFTIDKPNIIINPYEISPLTALIIFDTKEEVSPKITINGKDKQATYKHTFPLNKKHILPIYGLYPNSKNKVTIKLKNKKYDFTIKTDKLPKDFILPNEIISKRSKLENELYFFTPASEGYTVAYDINGDVRWYLTKEALWDISRLNNGNLLLSTERLMNPPYYMTGLYEMNLLGKIYKEISLPGGYHHDYHELDNGNLLIASDRFSDNTVEDIITEYDIKNKKIIRDIDLKEILRKNDGKSEDWSDYDWFHNNSVWYDKKTNSITLSGRHKDAVINIDYDTEELNWIIGDKTNWNEKYHKYFFKPIGELEWQWSQHSAMITPEGYVFILDNGNNKSKIKDEYVPANKSYTRGVMYDVNTDDMTIKQVWQYGKERGSSYYSPYISDVDYIGKKHYIVHSGGIVNKDGKPYNKPAGFGGDVKLTSITTELLNDEIIFEIKLPTNNYRVEKMPMYYENESFSLIKGIREGTLGKTSYKYKMYNLFKNKKYDQIKKEKEITLINEIDRFVFSGRFKKDDKVEIILNKNLMNKTYNLRVSKKPYTALCLDIFTQDENENGIEVTKNINKVGLKGKYNIYIKINNEIYNTNKKINVK